MTHENEGKGGTNQGPLDEAIKDLERAEEHLAHARADEAAADHEVKEAIEKIKEAEHGSDLVEVHVVHVNEVEKASFKEKISATLNAVWDKSYVELKIPRKPKDVFQTGGEHPKSLMNHLGLSLKQAKEQKVIENYHFGISSETGGA
jgi:hypothetical protein